MEPAVKEIWRPIENFRKRQLFHHLDYAVREQVKVHLTAHLQRHMESLVKNGLTYEELEKIQAELELCPSVLEKYPQKRQPLAQGLINFLRSLKSSFL